MKYLIHKQQFEESRVPPASEELKMSLQMLPKGMQLFSRLRNKNAIYVDKTRMIYELAKNEDKYFLSRPRRFGKSLLISTFASLFSDGLKHFKGLAIENLWTDKTYDVVHLSLSTVKDYSSVEEFRRKFHHALKRSFPNAGFVFDETKSEDTVEQLDFWLAARPESSLVLLIDEYDAPLTYAIDKPELFQAAQREMSGFYEVLKEHEGCLRFFFMTGVTKFSNTGIFSGFNNISDISLNPRFGELLGYTQKELEHYFGPYLDEACHEMKVSRSELLEKLRDHYDGFCFDKQASTHVFCPWSVLVFFDQKTYDFDDYWFQSGGQPSVLMKYLATRKLKAPMNFFQTVSMGQRELLSSAPYGKLHVDVLLHQTGYLTIRSVSPGGTIELGYPNKEVATSMASLYCTLMITDENYIPNQLRDQFLNQDPEKLAKFLNATFSSLNYGRFPITDEASFCGALQLLMVGAGLWPRPEAHSSLGRSDLEADIEGTRWVFELKFAKSGSEVPGLLDRALEQIRSRRYGEGLPVVDRLIRMALVFNAENRTIAARQLTDA